MGRFGERLWRVMMLSSGCAWPCWPGGDLAARGVDGRGPAAGLPAGLAVAAAGSRAAGQVARTQAPSWRARPRPSRLRRFTAAVRRLSQAWFLAGSAVAELEAASPPGGDLGDGPLDAGPVRHVVLAQPRAGGPVRTGGAQQAIVLVQVQRAAVLGGGAPLAQRAAAAGSPEDDRVLGGDVPGDPGRAGHGPGGCAGGEVIGGEPARDGGQQRPGLDHRLVPGRRDSGAQVPGAVGRIAVPGRLAAGLVWPPVTAGGLGRHELRGDRRIRVPGPGGPGQLLIGDDPGLRVGGHMRPVPVPAGLGGLASVPGLGVHG